MFTACAPVALWSAFAGAAQPDWLPAPASEPRRVIHYFDFDERRQGNVEDLPRYWTLVHGPQFPRFVRSGFDESRGHPAPPSFHVQSMGRSAAFQYDGPEIPVRAGSEYRIDGVVRLAGVVHARACVSAHYLDADRQAMLETTRRTLYMGVERGAEWSRFEVQLPPAPAGAMHLGLVVWILQDAAWNKDRSENEISPVDVDAQAWFDNIFIYRLPRLEISTRCPGNVVEQDAGAALWVTIADSAAAPVTAQVTITSPSGDIVLQRDVGGGGARGRPFPIELSSLRPGLYEAQAEVIEENRTVLARSIAFLLQSPLPSESNPRTKSFGIVLDPLQRANPEMEAALLHMQPARAVKIPIESVAEQPTVGIEKLLRQLANDHFLITGVVGSHGLPENAAKSGSDFGSVPRQLTSLAADFAGSMRYWQIGLDGGPLVDRESIEKSTAELKTQLRDYAPQPKIALPMGTGLEVPDVKWPADQVTLPVSEPADLWLLPETIANLRKQGYDEVSAFVPPLPPETYAREARLNEWAKRLIATRHAGADVVFVPQLWKTRNAPGDPGIAPLEEYAIFRTVAGMLGGADPGPALPVADHIRCLTFRTGEKSVLALWDENPPPGGRFARIQVGDTDRAVSVWGELIPLRRNENGLAVVPVSASPIFINNLESWLIDLATSLSIDPSNVESGTELVTHDLVMRCSDSMPRTLELSILPPPGIEVTPRTLSMTASGGMPARVPLTIRYPHNESAGLKTFLARIELTDPQFMFEIPLTVGVATADVDVWGRAILVGDDLVLEHVIQNQAGRVLSFRSCASVPGRPRQYRPIANLAPGDTQVLKYRFSQAGDLTARHVSLSLRELNDGPRQHSIDLVVP